MKLGGAGFKCQAVVSQPSSLQDVADIMVYMG